MLKLPEALLRLAAAVAPDDGEEVLAVARGLLGTVTPFDAGEVHLQRADGPLCRSLAGSGEPLAAGDLLAHLAAVRHPLRLDSLDEAGHFPETRKELAHRRLHTLLALPVEDGRGLQGAVVIARAQAWGLVGASLHQLVPLAGMLGVALDRALMLSERPANPGEIAMTRTERRLAAAEQALFEARAELGEAERELAEVRAERDALRQRLQNNGRNGRRR